MYRFFGFLLMAIGIIAIMFCGALIFIWIGITQLFGKIARTETSLVLGEAQVS